MSDENPNPQPVAESTPSESTMASLPHLPAAFAAAAERWIEGHIKPAADGRITVEKVVELLPELERYIGDELRKAARAAGM